MSGLFKLTFDDSAFQSAFNKIEERLNRHEEMILELQKLIQQKPNRDEMDQFKQDLTREIDNKMHQFQLDVYDIIDEKVSHIENKFKDKLSALPDIELMIKRLSMVEEVSNKDHSILGELQNHVLTIATCYGGVGKVKPYLNDNLSKNLNVSTNLINNNFQSIFNSLKGVKGDIQKCLEEIKNGNKIQNDNINIDISNYDPKPEYQANWREPPDLPKIYKFDSIVDEVGYLYDMVPKLQGYLLAMHNKILDNTEGISNIMSKEALDNMLEKIKAAILEMDNDLTELKDGISKNLTRGDVLQMIKDTLKLEGRIEGTSIGGVKCIACGRDMPLVNGALTEDEAAKRLGLPPNSIAFINSLGANTQLFSNADSLKKGINETPRSVRSFHACKVTKRNRS